MYPVASRPKGGVRTAPPHKIVGVDVAQAVDWFTDSVPVYAGQYVADESGLVNELRVKLTAIGCDLKVAIWNDTDDKPTSLLGNSAAYSPAAVGWNTIPLVVPCAIVGGAKYWMGFQLAEGGKTAISALAGVGFYSARVGLAYNTFPLDPFGWPDDQAVRMYCFAGWCL